MPNRMLRDWTDSDKVHLLSAEAERFFTRLIMKADDFGRYHANIKLLRANLFPLYEKLKEEKITSWLAECENAGLILCYDADGKKYLEIKVFDQKLKVRRSKYPPSNQEDRIALQEGYVYIIGTNYDSPVKIGFSVNPWSRLKEITINHPEKLELLLTVKADKKLESEIHKSLKQLRVKNEWFKLNKNVIDCIISFSKAEIDRETLLVELRSISSPLRSRLEDEVEYEVEREVEGNNDPFFQMFRRAAGKHITDEELFLEVARFKNKYPNNHANRSGALINTWVANIGRTETRKKEMVQ